LARTSIRMRACEQDADVGQFAAARNLPLLFHLRSLSSQSFYQEPATRQMLRIVCVPCIQYNPNHAHKQY